MSMTIQHITCPSGDWEVVLINGEIDAEDHSIPSTYWLSLLKDFGFHVTRKEISDEAMEINNFYEGE